MVKRSQVVTLGGRNLSSNKYQFIPESVWQLNSLKVLDMTGNKYSNLHFTEDQFHFLSNLTYFGVSDGQPCLLGYVKRTIKHVSVCVGTPENADHITPSRVMEPYNASSMDFTTFGCEAVCSNSPCIRYNDSPEAPLCQRAKCQRDQQGRSWQCVKGILGNHRLQLEHMDPHLFNHIRKLEIPTAIKEISIRGYGFWPVAFHEDSFLSHGNVAKIELQNIAVVDGNLWVPLGVKELHVVGCDLHRIPPPIVQLSTLTSLDLGYNSLSSLPQLKSVYLKEL